MADPKDKPPVDPARIPKPLRSALRAEREATIARLQDAVAADDLDLDELEERLDLALQARNSDELHVLVQDLPAYQPSAITMRVVDHAQLPALVTQAQPSNLPALRPDLAPALIEPDTLALTAIFSGHDLTGRRVMPRTTKIRAIFGGVNMDLREATFQPGVTTIHVKATFGGVAVLVPPHVRVECLGTGIFGGFSADNRGADDTPDSDDMPLLRIVGRAIFGGVSAERRRLRKALAKS